MSDDITSQRGLRSVGIIGAGTIGRNHASAILCHPNLRVAAVVDPYAPAGHHLADRIAAGTGEPGVHILARHCEPDRRMDRAAGP